MRTTAQKPEPNQWKWALNIAAAAGLTGILCCIAPVVLFMLGMMGGIYAVSFADFFYLEDGSPGNGAWLLRFAAVVVGITGLWLYHKRQVECSMEAGRRNKNLVLLSVFVATLSIGFYLTLQSFSTWFFDLYIVPAQQTEYDELGNRQE